MSRLRRGFAWLLARFFFGLATSCRYFGNKHGAQVAYVRAVEAFSRAIAYDVTYASAYLQRGILYWRELNQPRWAVLDLTMAYDLDPNLIEARFNRGIAYQQLRNYEQAISDFQAYLQVGQHPYWREYAENMVLELRGPTPEPHSRCQPA